MRAILTLLFYFLLFSGFSQDPITINPRQIESVQGEILIKLKDEVEPGIISRTVLFSLTAH